MTEFYLQWPMKATFKSNLTLVRTRKMEHLKLKTKLQENCLLIGFAGMLLQFRINLFSSSKMTYELEKRNSVSYASTWGP